MGGINTDSGTLGAAYADFVADQSSAPPWWCFLQSKCLQMLIGADRFGLPITYLGLGPGDFVGCEREVGFEALIMFVMMLHDRFLDLARENMIASGGSAVDAPTGGIFIIDLHGLGLRHYKELGVLKKLGDVSNSVMPERTRKHFVINTPTIFASL